VSTQLARAYSKYGASMGRDSDPLETITGKVHLERVRLDRGGYDNGGAYWGVGLPLWRVWNELGEAFFRAPNRDAAKAKLPGRRFFR
jgi:hypothetical protein